MRVFGHEIENVPRAALAVLLLTSFGFTGLRALMDSDDRDSQSDQTKQPSPVDTETPATPVVGPQPAEAVQASIADSVTTVTPEASRAGWQQIQVVSGDTLGALALTYGTTVEELVAKNQLQSQDWIMEGQLLWVPQAADTTVAARVEEQSAAVVVPPAQETVASRPMTAAEQQAYVQAEIEFRAYLAGIYSDPAEAEAIANDYFLWLYTRPTADASLPLNIAQHGSSYLRSMFGVWIVESSSANLPK